MSEQEEQRMFRPKIYRLDARGKVLDFQDFILHEESKNGTLSEGKIVLNFTEYDLTTKKATATFKHYINVDVARRVFSDILNYRFRKGKEDRYEPLLKEYKGGPHHGNEGWEVESRGLFIYFDDKLNMGPAIVISFALGEGEDTQTGAVKPKGQAKYTGQIMVPLASARAAAATILDYISSTKTAIMLNEIVAESEKRIDEKLSKLTELIPPTKPSKVSKSAA